MLTDGRRRRLSVYTISLPTSLRLRWANENQINGYVKTKKSTLGKSYKQGQPELKKINSWTTAGQTQDITSSQKPLRALWRGRHYTPAKCVCGGILFSHCPSVRPSFRRPSVTFWFYLNIFNRLWWNLIKPCKHIDILKINMYNRKLRARGQLYESYCPL